MKARNILWTLILMVTVFAGCKDDDDNPNPDMEEMEYFLVANRGSSTVSVFDATTNEKTMDITLPAAGAGMILAWLYYLTGKWKTKGW